MKEILMRNYGTAEVLYEAENTMPSISDTQLLVKMAATSVNHFDIAVRSGVMMSTMPPEMQPKMPHLLGLDFAGTVVEVGNAVTDFKPGDHVMGISQSGTYAKYIAVNIESTVKLSDSVDLQKIAGLPVVACTAWSAVINNGKVSHGQTVLVHGGAGGVGHIAIQLAKQQGAKVITTGSQRNKEFLTSLGADTVIDYATTDFVEVVSGADVVIDTIGGEEQQKSFSVLKKGGKLISVAAPPDPEKAHKYGVEALFVRGDTRSETLQKISDAYTRGELILEVEKRYPFTLDGIISAHTDLELGHNRGKRLIIME